MSALASLAELELVIQANITDPAQVAAAEYALLAASESVREYTRQTLTRVVGDSITLDVRPATRHLHLPELPVDAVSQVREAGVLLQVGTDYQWYGATGKLERAGRRYWRPGPRAVTLTYTHGYDPLPEIIGVVTARAASRLYQASLRAADAGGVLGVASKSLGDFSVAYAGESVVEGTMGASGSRLLLLSEKDMLNRYRV